MFGLSKAPPRHNLPIIRPFDPLDVVRCSVIGGPAESDRAFTLGGPGSRRPRCFSRLDFRQAGLSLRRTGCARVCCKDNRVGGGVTAGQQSGPKSREIKHRYLQSSTYSKVPELLETVSRAAAANRAERVFVRLRRDDSLSPLMRRSEFYPCISENLYGTPAELPKAHRGASSDQLPEALRSKSPRDEYGLFQLFNAVAPSQVRRVICMTFQEWLSSREQPQGRCRKFVLERDGTVRGWLMTVERARQAQLAVAVHLGHDGWLDSNLDLGLRSFRDARSICCLAPEYEGGMLQSLERKGLATVSEYVTMVKSVAIAAEENAPAAATIPSG